MLRVCFNRKNRTVSKLLTSKPVLQMLQANRKRLAESRGEEDPEVAEVKAAVLAVLKERNLLEPGSTCQVAAS